MISLKKVKLGLTLVTGNFNHYIYRDTSLPLHGDGEKDIKKRKE